MFSLLFLILTASSPTDAVWNVKSVNFVNDCQSNVFVLGVGWIDSGKSKRVTPGEGIMPFVNDRISASYEELAGVGLDRHMNVLEMNDGSIIDTGSSFELHESHPNLMGYWGWYNLSMEVTTWGEEGVPFCTGGYGGARTILDMSQCEAHGGKILREGSGEVCTKQDETHIFCSTDQALPIYKFLLQSTSHWKADMTWESDADTNTPLVSFLCDPIPQPPQRGVGFMIGCNPRSNTIGTYQVRFCPASKVSIAPSSTDAANINSTEVQEKSDILLPLAHRNHLRGASPAPSISALGGSSCAKPPCARITNNCPVSVPIIKDDRSVYTTLNANGGATDYFSLKDVGGGTLRLVDFDYGGWVEFNGFQTVDLSGLQGFALPVKLCVNGKCQKSCQTGIPYEKMQSLIKSSCPGGAVQMAGSIAMCKNAMEYGFPTCGSTCATVSKALMASFQNTGITCPDGLDPEQGAKVESPNFWGRMSDCQDSWPTGCSGSTCTTPLNCFSDNADSGKLNCNKVNTGLANITIGATHDNAFQTCINGEPAFSLYGGFYSYMCGAESGYTYPSDNGMNIENGGDDWTVDVTLCPADGPGKSCEWPAYEPCGDTNSRYAASCT